MGMSLRGLLAAEGEGVGVGASPKGVGLGVGKKSSPLAGVGAGVCWACR